jgi:hypothetical protein
MSGIIQTMMTNYKPAASGFIAPTYTSTDCIVYYDPANPLSYGGTGPTITDLSGYNNDGTINNATYSATNGGTFSFLGSAGNQYIMTSNLYSLTSNYFPDGISQVGAITIEMWVYATANGSALMEVGQNSISTGFRTNNIELGTVGPFFAPRAGYLSNGSGAMVYNGAGAGTALNKWMNFCLVYTGATPWAPVMYYNGVSGGITNSNAFRRPPAVQTPLISGQTPLYSGWAFGAGSATNTLNLTTAMYTGRIGIMRVYRRGLTAAEILVNYNGVKARYGL